MKIYMHPKFLAALFIIVQEWEQPKDPSTDERIKEIYLSLYAGDLGSFPGMGRSSGGGNGYPLQYSCPENPRGQRSLVGYSLWGCKELDMTERLSTYRIIAHPYQV